jgi:O-antigen/teichoic acid export membrane protein
MSIQRLVARNIVWNWAGTIITMAAGFVLMPHLVAVLGNTVYGLWALIGSYTNYFGFLDLGIRGAVGRNVAYYRARGDTAGVNAMLNTALRLLAAAAVLGVLVFGALALFFPGFLDVPRHLTGRFQWAMLIAGVNLGLVLLFNAFDATLWGYQRFDILNAIDIPAAFLRVGLVSYFIIVQERGLVTLALLTLALTCYCGMLKAWFSFRVDPGLRLSLAFVSWPAARKLFGYGSWYFLLSLSRLLNTQIGPTLVGKGLSVAAVTPFVVCTQLIRYGSATVVSATGVLTPLATALHATNEGEKERALFLEGSKYCTALALYFMSLFLLLGRSFLGLWMGESWLEKFDLIAILALGEALPMSQMVTWNILLGKARHPLLASWSLIENVVAVPLSLALMPTYGLAGFCLAFAAPAVVCRGVLPIAYGCVLLHMPTGRFAQHVFLPVTLTWLPAALGLAGLVGWRAPADWSQLFLYASAFSAIYLALICSFLIGWDRIADFFRPRIVEVEREPLRVHG